MPVPEDPSIFFTKLAALAVKNVGEQDCFFIAYSLCATIVPKRTVSAESLRGASNGVSRSLISGVAASILADQVPESYR
jgi:hypothetical protein